LGTDPSFFAREQTLSQFFPSLSAFGLVCHDRPLATAFWPASGSALAKDLLFRSNAYYVRFPLLMDELSPWFKRSSTT